MIPDIAKIEGLIAEVAAEEILPRFQRLSAHEVTEKGGGELVTVADIAAERRLESALLAAIPGSLVLGEEAFGRDEGVIEHLTDAGPVWIVDPIDGTHNFAHGSPVFAVMVAFALAGRTRAAWIHEPARGRTATAEEGAGAWLSGQRMQVARAPEQFAEMVGTLHVGRLGNPETSARIQRRRHLFHAIKSLRCAGVEYLRLASGEEHFTLWSKLMPWDHMPGLLIHEEAGGVAAYFDGSPYDPRRYRERGLLVASDPAAWEMIRAALLSP